MTPAECIQGMAVWFVECGKYRFGRILRVRRGGHTVEVKAGKRVMLVHPECLRALRVRGES